MDFVRIAARVASRTFSRVAAGMAEMADSPGGPWSPASAEALQSKAQQGQYADANNGVIAYVKAGGRIWSVTDSAVLHGEDAMSPFEVEGVDAEGMGTSDPESGPVEDLASWLSSFDEGDDPGPPSDPGPDYDTHEEKRGDK